MMEIEIKRAFSNALNVLEDDIEVIERLLGGMSHFTYKVKYNKEYYTVRIIGEGGNLYVDRHEEYENIKRIESLNLNNETIYFDESTGLKIAKYIEGTVLSQVEISLYLKDIADTLKKLHKSNIKPYKDYELVHRLNKYESYINIRTPRYLELKNEWNRLYDEFYKKFPKVFCHNDAQRSNIVVSKTKLCLLDWEYAALNSPFYDIASFGNINFEDSLRLLDAYLERKATKEEINHVKFYRMFQALQWHQVALYKDSIGLGEKLKFDFNLLASKYLDLANKLYNEIKE